MLLQDVLRTGILFLFSVLVVFPSSAQHTYRALVLDAHHDEPLAGVNVIVEGTTIGGTTNGAGEVFLSSVPAGEQAILFSFVGFEEARRTYTFPLADPSQVDVVRLEEGHEELE